MRKLATAVPFFLLLVAAITWVPICLPQQQRPQNTNREETDEDDVIRVSTTLVTVTANVKDRHGKLVPNLGRADFHLYEDGVEQEILYFDSPKEPGTTRSESAIPLTVALLLDVSDSTQSKLDQIQRASLAFLDELQLDERVAIISFDKNATVLATVTNDRKVLREAIMRTRTGGGTSLYSAVDIAINHSLSRISGRKAIVLFTDGVDTASVGATYDSTVSAAEKSDAVIYPIQFNTYDDFAASPSRQTNAIGLGGMAHATKNGEMASEAYKRGTNYLRLLAEKTGGMMQYSDSIKYLSRSFTRIASQLRQQYALGYYPKNRTVNGLPRQIKVRVGMPEASVSARKSYVYAPRH